MITIRYTHWRAEGDQKYWNNEKKGQILQNGRVIGTFDIMVDRRQVHIGWFAIYAGERRRGKGTIAYQTLEKRLVKLYGTRKVTLFWADEEAKKFWQAVGFKETDPPNGEWDMEKNTKYQKAKKGKVRYASKAT